ncbi:BCL9 domain-containing protein legless isoform X3 [Rhodnius prolixus]|uniref:BCL9 domain-containing protein legless isoform X3 n=1 Tax=Rhodnius prolixus TaxID=13249 RepID=UPI003D18E6AB
MIKDKPTQQAAKKKNGDPQHGSNSNNNSNGNGSSTNPTTTGANLVDTAPANEVKEVNELRSTNDSQVNSNTISASNNNNGNNNNTNNNTNNNNNSNSNNNVLTEVKEEPDDPDPSTTLHEPTSSPLEELHNSPILAHPPEANVNKEVQSACLQNSMQCKNPTKSENGVNSENAFRNEACDVVESVSVGVGPNPVTGQPLASNVVSKQSVSLDAQYMQQQSQIFVFSTALANKAADAVIQGHFASIIAYHCSQPRTKKYLEGSNRSAPGMMGGQCAGNAVPTGQLMEPTRDLKNPAQTNHHQMISGHVLTEGMMTPLADVTQDMGLAPQPLAGVKVPDENLTPQQRQHREEQLATLRKMQQILFPEALSGNNDEVGAEQPPVTTHDSNIEMNKTGGNTADWHKLQIQMYEEQKNRVGSGGKNGGQGGNGGLRGASSGPPPTYQQATRSASVPIALQSPSPASPNNTTSNLSLPSPRTCSAGGINSPHPSDKIPPSPVPQLPNRNTANTGGSNPPTPLSAHHLSPKHKDKMPAPNEFSPSSSTSAQNSQQSPVESLYCRAVGQKTAQPGKEPNLMPVPSPQQIQYLNTFEGQELTIQKQPNTSLKETSQKSPTICVAGNSTLDNVVTNANTAGATEKVNCQSPRHPVGPSTPDIVNSRGFPGELDSNSDKQTGNPQQMHQRKMETTNYATSPHSNDRCHMGVFLGGKCGVSNVYLDQPVMAGKCPNNPGNGPTVGPPQPQQPPQPPQPPQQQDKDNMAPSGYPCIGPDNVPLNPNRSVVPSGGKGAHFDPISSLAQMSQQLTNSVPNSPAGQPMSNIHPGMGFNSGAPSQMLMGDAMHHMGGPPQNQMQHFNPRGQCTTTIGPAMSVSPKMLQGYPMSQRPMPRMGYNGASIQVKPNAPNTIQYLPSRGQPGPGVSVGVGNGAPGQVAPRGAPSLDFLQRFSSPLSNLDAKLPTHNLQYFPNNYPQGNMDMSMCSGMRAGMRTNNQTGMLRLQAPGVQSSAQMSPIGFGGPADGFQSNCQLLGGSGGPGKGLAPDASQPLPPSMGQANNFKNSTFIGPTTADPNYAQQFHNFQQQLYATNTRGQLGAQGMPPGQHYFVPK